MRSTSLLEPIRKKYPRAQLTWVTEGPADQLLRSHPHIDRVLTTSPGDILQLSALKFDVAFVIDKSLKAAGILASTKALKVFGFRVDARSGGILPATPAASELWSLGLDNHKKFVINQKTEVQLVCEALELPFDHVPEYDLPITANEQQLREKRQRDWSLQRGQPIIGINTGCSSVLAAKKLSVEFQREIVQELLIQGYENLVLLGGPEDQERNQEIGRGLPVFQSPTGLGLRDGLVSVAACDLVLSGDSLGMHMAIALKKFVVVWFGPSCAQEIELYGRGIKIQTKATCSPCWKRSCEKTEMCYDQVDLKEILQAFSLGQNWWQQQSESLLSRPLF